MQWISVQFGLREHSNKHSEINGLYPNRHGLFLRKHMVSCDGYYEKNIEKTRLSCIIVLLKIGMIKNEKTDNQNPKRKIDWICK